MKKPLISIIIPVYNAEKWIIETLESVSNQTYKNLEIICIDDGSSDNSCDIVDTFSEKDSRIKLYKQQNSGVSASRNYGMEVANGDYFAFIDADDIMLPTMIEKLINLLMTENSDIAFCEFTRFFPSGKQLKMQEKSFKKLKENSSDIKYFWYSTKSDIKDEVLYTDDLHGSVCRSLFKKSIIYDNKIRFNTKLRFAEDQIFICQYLHASKKISYTDQSLMLYRANTKNWVYHNLFDNDMELLKCQLNLLAQNKFYNDREKHQLKGYLECSTYFMIINEEFMFKPNVAEILEGYNKNPDFKNLLTVYNFYQKQKINPNWKKTPLFLLLKLHLFELARILFPDKRY